jgi:hypothetical protein
VASKELTKPENAKKLDFLPQHFGHPEKLIQGRLMASTTIHNCTFFFHKKST